MFMFNIRQDTLFFLNRKTRLVQLASSLLVPLLLVIEKYPHGLLELSSGICLFSFVLGRFFKWLHWPI